MKITLLGDDAIRLEPTPGMLTIEAASADVSYSPFHMLASGLATCTLSVLQSWATHAKVSVDDLSLEVQWRFADDPHRVSNMAVIVDWKSLPAERMATARRVAALCTIHATLTHPPAVDILSARDLASDHHHDDGPAAAEMHGEPSAAPPTMDGAAER
ncbi:MAG: OsmC family protein [Polaromonas sp.]|nr:OsmC family protein [Gemmatimonadaceae bacterium]